MTYPHFPRILGAICVLVALASHARADLTHRWSFNEAAGAAPSGTIVTDSIVSAQGIVRGGGATLDGAMLTLPGTTTCGASDATISAYVDLPNGLISSRTTLTVEVWATPIDGRNWQHLFEFGRLNNPGDGAGAPGEWTGTTGGTPAAGSQSGDTLLLTLCRGTDLNQQRQSNRHDGIGELQADSNLPTTPGQEYHYVLTFEDGAGAFGAGGARVIWYRDGVLITTMDVPYNLSDIQDVNNWLGRNQWSILSTTNASYNEFRLYDHVFDLAEVISSRDAGPNAVFGPPETTDDVLTIHDGQKIQGDVLGNDTGLLDPATVEIVQLPTNGTATPQPDGRILYAHDGAGAGNDSFTYRVTGTGGISQPATVTVDISASLRIASNDINVPDEPPSTSIEVTPAFSGLFFFQPTDMATAPGDTSRIWVTQKNGMVQLIPDAASPMPSMETFFDLPALLASRGEAIGNPGNERGLLGMVFHPDYQTNGYFYLFYSVNILGTNYSRLSRFSVDPMDPDAADPASELVLIQQQDDFGLHLGGDMHFGTDGYLYFSTGDEGGQFDGSSNGQTITGDLFSGIMRIDVDKLPGNPEPHPHPAVPTDMGLARYSIPADNPYVTANPTISYNGQDIPAGDVRTEFFANGFRNPWRFSIDEVTGEIWCADVGQNQWEEINLVVSGGNYGWSFREGLNDGPRVLETPAGWSGVDPLYVYGHGGGEFQGNSVTGGLVYRGNSYPELEGAYLFADFVSGNIWALRRPDGMVDVERIAGEGGIVAFGIDPSNEDVLMVDYDNNRLVRLTTGEDIMGTFPQTLSDTGLFSDLTDMSPAPGLLPYEPNLRFWSDYALKSRWFMIPDGTSQMTWSENDPWTYPDGMIWVKHFDLELERGNPATARRIETRILVKNAEGSYGVSYRWNDDETEATLVGDAGENFDVEVTVEGMPQVQEYRIPSRAECSACHTPQAGHALSFNTRQLNQDHTFHGFSGNQLDLLDIHGFFTNVPDDPATLPRHVRPDEAGFTLEEKARSYLAVNCANCHMAGGTVEGSWDGRAYLTLEETGLINGAATNNGGDPANLLIVPGDTAHSIVLNRVAETNGFSRMPPIGSTELDQEAIQLLTDWINELGAPPPPPGNVTATDGTSITQVDIGWDSVTDAVSYEVWRSTIDDSTTATLLNTTMSTNYSDATSTPAQVNYYWIRTVTAEATSDFSTSDGGYRSLPVATGVSATMAVHTDRVSLQWLAVAGATTYDIYRSTTDDFGTAALLGNVGALLYDDSTAYAGTSYYYWVVARNEFGAAMQSISVAGSEALPPPANVQATDGDHEDRIAVTWDSVTDATTYTVYRNTIDDPGSSTEIGSAATTAFDDLTAEVATDYFYWVRSVNPETDSVLSSSDGGSVGETPAIYLPDLTIGKGAAGHKGDDVYNTSGAGQKLVLTTKGKPLRFRSHVQNDGDTPDILILSGQSRTTKWNVKHFQLSPTRMNISSAVRAGTYQTNTIDAGAEEPFEIWVKAKRKALPRRGRLKLWFRGHSLNGGQVDQVIGLAKLKR